MVSLDKSAVLVCSYKIHYLQELDIGIPVSDSSHQPFQKNNTSRWIFYLINLSGKGSHEGHRNSSTKCLLYFKMERISFQLGSADKNISF